MGHPKVKIIVALAVDDFPARIAMGMPGKGVDFYGNVLRPEDGQESLQVGNAAEVLPTDGEEGRNIGEVLSTQLCPQVSCALDAQNRVFCAG